MKPVVFSICLLLGFISIAQGHPQPPITRYVQVSPMVCIAQVTAVANGVATFTVKEIIKGAPPSILKLQVAAVPEAITLQSEWLLASARANENTVGWAMKGDYGWVNAPVKRIDGTVYLIGKYGYADPSVAPDNPKGLSLDRLRQLAQTPPPKP